MSPKPCVQSLFARLPSSHFLKQNIYWHISLDFFCSVSIITPDFGICLKTRKLFDAFGPIIHTIKTTENADRWKPGAKGICLMRTGENGRFQKRRRKLSRPSTFWYERYQFVLEWKGNFVNTWKKQKKQNAMLRFGWDENGQFLKAFMADGLWSISIINTVHSFSFS